MRILTLLLKPQTEGFYLRPEPVGIVRTQYGAHKLPVQQRLFSYLRVIATEHARGDVAMAAQIFGGTVNNDIGPAVKRMPETGSGEGIIDYYSDAPVSG